MALVSNTPVTSTQFHSLDLMRAKADAEVAMMRAKHEAELEMARIQREQIAAEIQSVAMDQANPQFDELREEIATILQYGDKRGDARPDGIWNTNRNGLFRERRSLLQCERLRSDERYLRPERRGGSTQGRASTQAHASTATGHGIP